MFSLGNGKFAICGDEEDMIGDGEDGKGITLKISRLGPPIVCLVLNILYYPFAVWSDVRFR